MRYIWNMAHDYRSRAGPITRLALPVLAHYMRLWDAVSADRVDHFIANSRTVAARIRRYYARNAEVVWPPVAVDEFEVVGANSIEDFMLMVGELVPYKRPELAVEAFNRMGAKLVVIGGGEMLAQIRRIAGPTVTVMGPRPFADLRHHYARCRALIFPGVEDFGIVPVEAMASGRPVIAYGRGGATETVIPNLSGLLFHDQSVEGIVAAVRDFQSADFDPAEIVGHARRFSVPRFVKEMTAQLDRLLTAREQVGSWPTTMLNGDYRPVGNGRYGGALDC
jgi:glycosyltransferase involved in cell wall biosynthesis